MGPPLIAREPGERVETVAPQQIRTQPADRRSEFRGPVLSRGVVQPESPARESLYRESAPGVQPRCDRIGSNVCPELDYPEHAQSVVELLCAASRAGTVGRRVRVVCGVESGALSHKLPEESEEVVFVGCHGCLRG